MAALHGRRSGSWHTQLRCLHKPANTTSPGATSCRRTVLVFVQLVGYSTRILLCLTSQHVRALCNNTYALHVLLMYRIIRCLPPHLGGQAEAQYAAVGGRVMVEHHLEPKQHRGDADGAVAEVQVTAATHQRQDRQRVQQAAMCYTSKHRARAKATWSKHSLNLGAAPSRVLLSLTADSAVARSTMRAAQQPMYSSATQSNSDDLHILSCI